MERVERDEDLRSSINERGDAVIEEKNGAGSSGKNDLFGRKIARLNV